VPKVIKVLLARKVLLELKALKVRKEVYLVAPQIT
jgi:hypothetical protein